MESRTSISLLASVLLIAACEGGQEENRDRPEAGQETGADAGAVAGLDAVKNPDVPGAPDTPDTLGARDTLDVPDTLGAPDMLSAPDALDASETLGASDTLDGPDLLSAVDMLAVPDAPSWPEGKYISVEEVHAKLLAHDPDMLLVNVVDEEFYDLGHIEGSLAIPWDTLEGRLAELDRERHIVIYCRRGVRSESAYTILVDHGFQLLWVMEGGIERWIASGYPTVAL